MPCCNSTAAKETIPLPPQAHLAPSQATVVMSVTETAVVTVAVSVSAMGQERGRCCVCEARIMCNR
jgi:hypothetical protein